MSNDKYHRMGIEVGDRVARLGLEHLVETNTEVDFFCLRCAITAMARTVLLEALALYPERERAELLRLLSAEPKKASQYAH